VQLGPGQKLAIGWIHAAGAVSSPFCTGNLIDDSVVLTARHCFDERLDNRIEFDPLQVEFSVGVSPDATEGTFGVNAFELHPHADLALLRLTAPVTAQTSARPLPMITVPLAQDLLTSTAEAAGHGTTETGRTDGLYFVSLPTTCVDDDYVEVTGDGMRGICGGDSGGPLLVTQPDGTVGILAIEHQGEGSCVGRDYLVRLDRHRVWLESSLNRLLTGTSADPCGGLRYRGRCVDGRVEWCQNGNQILTQDCPALGQICGLIDPKQGLHCRDEVECAPETPPQCSGGMLVECLDERVIETDCVAQGKVCTSNAQGARCVPRCGITPGDAVDDGSGVFRRPGEKVQFKGVFGLGCALSPAPAPAAWWMVLLGLAWIRRR
jgi:MYXO-CTERM domain-containing protein